MSRRCMEEKSFWTTSWTNSPASGPYAEGDGKYRYRLDVSRLQLC